LFVPVTHASWVEVSSLRPDSRGGFGSTGAY
jgi:dUTPase